MTPFTAATDNSAPPRRYTTDMKTNPKNFSRMIATTLAVMALPSFAQEMPAPGMPPSMTPKEPSGEARTMRQAGERLPSKSTADVPKPWRIGLMVEPIDASLRDHLDIPEKSGVVVTKSLENGPADKAGIKKKDIILSVNGQAVDSIEPLRESVEAAAKNGKDLRLSVMSKGVRREVVIQPDRPPMPPKGEDRTPDRSSRPRIIYPNMPTPSTSDAKLREHEQMIRRMAEQNNQLKSQLEKQQNEMTRTREVIEQLTKTVREMKQQMKEADKE